MDHGYEHREHLDDDIIANNEEVSTDDEELSDEIESLNDEEVSGEELLMMTSTPTKAHPSRTMRYPMMRCLMMTIYTTKAPTMKL